MEVDTMNVPNHEEPEQHAGTEEALPLDQYEQESNMPTHSVSGIHRRTRAALETCGGTLRFTITRASNS